MAGSVYDGNVSGRGGSCWRLPGGAGRPAANGGTGARIPGALRVRQVQCSGSLRRWNSKAGEKE